uniref:Uncharacterized protein n=1 Tax=Entomoneis paludosa TaxID=265537 RepID=A0A7S2YFG3_9STRA
MAKVSLLDSKRSKAQAERLAFIFQRLDNVEENGNTNQVAFSSQDLEALIEGKSIQKENPVPAKAKTQAPPPDPWLSKPSAEIKQEVLRLKNEKQVKEATRLLQIFKQVLQKEKQQEEAEKCRKLAEGLSKRLETCVAQIRLWQYYTWFCDAGNMQEGQLSSQQAQEQYTRWTDYARKCQQAIHSIQKNGSASVTISSAKQGGDHDGSNGALLVLKGKESDKEGDDVVVSMVERMMNSSSHSGDGSGLLEVAVLGIFKMHENEKLQKVLSKQKDDESKGICPNLRIECKVNLPLQNADPQNDQSHQHEQSPSAAHLFFYPTVSQRQGSTFQYIFGPSSQHSRQKLLVPRDDSKQSKTILRRMETKSVQLSVYYTTQASPMQQQGKDNPKSSISSWLFGASHETPKEPAKPDGDSSVLLGKVSVDMRHLLSRNCVAGDYPLELSSHEKPVGGSIRLGLCIRPCLDLERYEGCREIEPPAIMVYQEQLSFEFHDTAGVTAATT